MTRKELTADIKNRVAAGESKRAIFSRYSMTEWEDAASRILPLQVTLAKRKRWRFLNWALVGCLSVITLFKVIDIIFMTGNLTNAGARIGIVLFGLAINVAVLVGVIRYSGIAYMITSIFILQSFAKILEAAGKMNFAFDLPTIIFVINASFAFAAFVLGLVLHRLMLPCTTFFFTTKKTAMGQPIFEC